MDICWSGQEGEETVPNPQLFALPGTLIGTVRSCSAWISFASGPPFPAQCPHSLLQQNRSARHQRDPPPVPDHDDQNAGGEEGLHGKPHFCKASVLVDTLGRNKVQCDICMTFGIMTVYA